MSRRVSAIDDSPSLFPFLAVLICTVGALVVLLVVMIRQSRLDGDADVRAAQQAEAEQSEAFEQARWEEEDWQWKTTILQAEREQLSDDLGRKRAELSHLEDHLRRVDQEVDQLIRAVEKLKLSQGEGDANTASIQAEIETLNLAIERSEAQSAKIREEVKQRRQAYAIVPYAGPNGTQRRPVFIECLSDRIVLQPTGVVLSSADFEPPLDVDNPLAAAIRATTEYFAQGGASRETPYPLLLVRPDGAESYAAARYALRSWETDFGYELIPADMKLSYPPPDARLAALQERVIFALRERRLAMQKAIPNQNARRYGLRASRNGGFVPVEADGDVGSSAQRSRRDTENGNRAGTPRERTAASFASDTNSRYTTRNVSDSSSRQNAAQNGTAQNGTAQNGTAQNGTAQNGTAQDAANQHGIGSGSSTDSREGFATTPGGSSAGRGNSRGASGNRTGQARVQGGQGGAGAATTGEHSASESTQDGDGHRGSRNGGPGDASAHNASAAQRPGSAGATSEAGGRAGSSTAANSGAAHNGSSAFDPNSDASSSGSASPGSPTAGTSGTSGPSLGMPGATPQTDRDQQMQAANISAVYDPMPSAAVAQRRKSRQKDWGLPSTAAGAIPIARPLHARLERDRLQLLPDRRSKWAGQDFSLEEGVAGAVDPLVTSVWQQIKGWGMAGSGVYWKPTLHVDVAKGAEAMYEDLENVLQGSGIAVTKSGSAGKKGDR